MSEVSHSSIIEVASLTIRSIHSQLRSFNPNTGVTSLVAPPSKSTKLGSFDFIFTRSVSVCTYTRMVLKKNSHCPYALDALFDNEHFQRSCHTSYICTLSD